MPSEEVGAAEWLRDRMHGFAVDVGSVIPHGFAAYARIFHPAWLPHMIEVRWSEVAASTGRLEALPATIHDGIRADSDIVNS